MYILSSFYTTCIIIWVFFYWVFRFSTLIQGYKDKLPPTRILQIKKLSREEAQGLGAPQGKAWNTLFGSNVDEVYGIQFEPVKIPAVLPWVSNGFQMHRFHCVLKALCHEGLLCFRSCHFLSRFVFPPIVVCRGSIAKYGEWLFFPNLFTRFM